MVNDSDDLPWPPSLFADEFREASEEAIDRQMDLYRRMLAASTGSARRSSPDLSDLSRASMDTAVFKTRVQSGGRISIPDAEREALGIDEGDLVQAFIIPIPKGDSDE
jgi:hypothetical protein